jgi:hypothetical protein
MRRNTYIHIKKEEGRKEGRKEERKKERMEGKGQKGGR